MGKLKEFIVFFLVFGVGVAMPMWGWITMHINAPELEGIWYVLFLISSYLVSYGATKWVEEKI